MILISDKAQQAGKHLIKEKYWADNGIEVIYEPLPCGDYVLGNEKVMDVIERKSKRGIEPKKMDFLGTYSVVVDTKKDMNEIEGDLIGKQHERFRDECILAQNNGIKLYILIENKDGIKSVQDVFRYTSTRRLRWFKIQKSHEYGKMLSVKIPSKPPVSGEQLAKIMLTMKAKYGVEFLFTTPEKSGARVIEILKGETNEEG